MAYCTAYRPESNLALDVGGDGTLVAASAIDARRSNYFGGYRMKITRTAVVAFVCAFALVIAPAALASPATSAYGGACSTASGSSSLCDSSAISSNTTTKASTSGSSLPFTGINVLELAGMGLVLVGAGFVVRHSRRPGSN
jgi:hypothetical protein